MGSTFDESLKRRLVGLAAKSREATLRVDTRPTGNAIAVIVVRISAPDDLRLGNGVDQAESKNEWHVETSTFGRLVRKWLSRDAMFAEFRRAHNSNVLATFVAEQIALVWRTETAGAVYELLTGAAGSRFGVTGTTLIAVEQRPEALCRFEDPVE